MVFKYLLKIVGNSNWLMPKMKLTVYCINLIYMLNISLNMGNCCKKISYFLRGLLNFFYVRIIKIIPTRIL